MHIYLFTWPLKILSIILLSNSISHAQEKQEENYQLEVSYLFLLNQGAPMTYQGTLLVGSESSLFSYQAKIELDVGELSSEQSGWDHQTYSFQIKDTTTYHIWSQSIGTRVFHLERLPGLNSLCVVKESFPDIAWHITGNQKLIQNFTCFEATGHFGGRDYTVWFTEQIPTSYGPWKFHGLPGLIVQLEDKLGEVQFYVESLRSFPNERVPYNPFQNASFQIMDRASYVEEMKQYFRSLEKRMVSRVGRGFDVRVKSTPIRSIEIYDF